MMKYKHFKPWFGRINKYLLQFFFFRLQLMCKTPYGWHGTMKDSPEAKEFPVLRISIIFFVKPLSGWNTPYVFYWLKQTINLYKKKDKS